MERVMQKRRLGHSDLEIVPIVFGGNVLGWTVDQTAANRLLDEFIDLGFNSIDTADTYSRWIPGNVGGESETIIGNWLKTSGKRNRVLIFTKLGAEMGPDKKGLSRKYMMAEVEESLKRLQIDTIDLYQSHRDDTETPMTEILESYADLIKQGKVRAIGASNFSAARLKEANATARKHNLPRYEVLQPKYNLYDRVEYEHELEQTCIKEEVGVIPYYGLANGFLTGKYRAPADFNKGARGSRMDSYLNPRGRRILAALDDISAAHKVKPAAVALAWLAARPSITAPIASATKPEQLADFAASARLQLSKADIAALDEASAP